ncbi:hypothetical protein N7467_001696 [Penicillium canescens]|nr:hypothetical protein N7467_001696 [Penicillium canescens]
MRDGRVRITTQHRLHPVYNEPEPNPAPPRGLTLMNAQAHYARMRSREVSERKQVGDAESLFHSEQRRKEEDEILGSSPFRFWWLLLLSMIQQSDDEGSSYSECATLPTFLGIF